MPKGPNQTTLQSVLSSPNRAWDGCIRSWHSFRSHRNSEQIRRCELSPSAIPETKYFIILLVTTTEKSKMQIKHPNVNNP